MEEKLVLVVDDDQSNLLLAQNILKPYYKVIALISGEQIMQFFARRTADLILLDINMPGKSGFEVMEELQADERLKKIPVIFLTADIDDKTESKCFSLGAVDYIRKPFDPTVMLCRVRRTLELESYRQDLEKIIEEKTQQISTIHQEVIVSLATLVENRDGSTAGHVRRVARYVKVLAEHLQKQGYDPELLTDKYIEDLYKAAPMHDIGKIAISDLILKKPGKLTEEEFEIMKGHTTAGEKILKDTMEPIVGGEYMSILINIALYHHEKWDGSGYPTGISGKDIPLESRILALSDVFDALVSKRCYKDPFSLEKSCEIIRESSGSHFDPDIVDAFFAVRDQFEQILQEERE